MSMNKLIEQVNAANSLESVENIRLKVNGIVERK